MHHPTTQAATMYQFRRCTQTGSESMNIRMHSVLFHILAMGSFLSPVGTIFYTMNAPYAQLSLNLICFAFLVPAACSLLFLYLVPARCDVADCQGRMEPSWENVAFGEYILHYRCTHCEHVFDTRFKMKFGGPNDWN